MKEEQRFILIALFPPLFFLTLIEFIPISYVIFYSFTDRIIFEEKFNFVSLENYISFLSSGNFINITFNSLTYGLVAAILQTILGLLLALILYRMSGPLSTIIKVILFIPYSIPYISVALLWQFLLDQSYGPINNWLIYLGLVKKPIPFLTSTNLAMLSVIGVTVWMLTSFSMLILYAALKAVPKEQFEAAQIDGAEGLQMFRYVTWPWISRMFYITLFLRFLFNFGKFDLIWLLTQGGPLRSTETFPINVWLTAFSEYRYGEAAAIAIVSLLILMIPLLLFIYVTREKG